MAEVAALARSLPSSFMRWWLGELGGLLPGRQAADRRLTGPALILDLHAEEATLSACRARGRKVLGRATGAEDGRAFIALQKRRYRRWPLIVRLAGDLGMRKVIELPLAARADLGNLLHFELDRLTPFSPDEVCFAWRVLETNKASDRMTVALEMAPKALVERATGIAAQHGRPLDRVEIEGGDREPLNLLAGIAKPEPGGRFRHLLPLIALTLLAVAIWLPMNRQQRVVDQLDQEIADVKTHAEETLALREKLDAETTEAGFLVEAKNGRASMTRVLAELTALIPDHSYIQSLDIQDGRVQLSGFADKASDLLTLLDRSDMFAAPEFRSAVTRDPRVGKERFQIAVELSETPS
ncbi:MAG: PilN domain-containing protein [Geminicoccaceae bacterium]